MVACLNDFRISSIHCWVYTILFVGKYMHINCELQTDTCGTYLKANAHITVYKCIHMYVAIALVLQAVSYYCGYICICTFAHTHKYRL